MMGPINVCLLRFLTLPYLTLEIQGLALTLMTCLSDLAFFPTKDCSGDPLLISPPASVLRERPVAGCSNYAAAGITTMSYKVV
jgi:hypothetical protein